MQRFSVDVIVTIVLKSFKYWFFEWNYLENLSSNNFKTIELVCYSYAVSMYQSAIPHWGWFGVEVAPQYCSNSNLNHYYFHYYYYLQGNTNKTDKCRIREDHYCQTKAGCGSTNSCRDKLLQSQRYNTSVNTLNNNVFYFRNRSTKSLHLELKLRLVDQSSRKFSPHHTNTNTSSTTCARFVLLWCFSRRFGSTT